MPCNPASLLLRIQPQKIENKDSNKYLYANVIAALFTIGKGRNNASFHQGMNKQIVLHIQYSLYTWMNLENIVSEVIQIQKDKYYMIPLYEISRIGKFIETGSI